MLFEKESFTMLLRSKDSIYEGILDENSIDAIDEPTLFKSLLIATPSSSKFNKRERVIIQILRTSVVAYILQGIKAKRAAYPLYKKCYSLSKKYFFLQGLFESSRFLSRYYGAGIGNLKKATFYLNEVDETLKYIQNELIAERAYASLFSYYNQSVYHNSAIKKKLHETFSILKNLDKNYLSPRFHRFALLVNIAYFESCHQYEQLIDFIESQLVYFNTLGLEFNTITQVLKIQKVDFLLRLGQYDGLESFILEISRGCRYKSVQWYRVEQIKVLYWMHIYEYTKAVDHIKVLRKQRAFERENTKNQKERFEILYLYSKMMLFLKNRCFTKADRRELRYYRSLNSLPKFNKDKKGMNITVLLVQLVFAILTKNDLGLEKLIDAIDKYMQRYLRESPFYRVSIFVKLIKLINRYNFNLIAIKRNAKPLLSRMNKEPFRRSSHPKEIELIEYSYLWSEIVAFMEINESTSIKPSLFFIK